MDWRPESWRAFEARQQPVYPEPIALDAALAEIAARPPLVTLVEIDALTAQLTDAQAGRAFLLQAGDCAERLSDTPAGTRAMAALIANLGGELEERGGLPVVRLGRIAGQFAKPRSQALERRDGRALPAWRGDSVNDMAFEAVARRPDPARLLAAYDHAAVSRQLLRGILFSSHEGLLLPFEETLVRRDSASGRWFGGSAHLLWIGARTLFPGSAHVELLRGLANPVALKCGPDLAADDLLRLLSRLNPERMAGRITLVIRMGAERIVAALPSLLRAARSAGQPVLWCCDPLHGNTVRGPDGTKRRGMARIEAEAQAFLDIFDAEGTPPGGLHLELTHRGALECDGRMSRDDCRDPRLNPDQARRIVRLFAASRAHRRMPALA
ncbi:3-deoxy-7-phosphoheptulonate synthase [Sphingosinicella sp.]|uniref:3-deoxy-7-phosphoheptulonate synthase n=1 Tax=Sphingosinicella sp. TaxID=1917971 RepID=UPI00403793E4